jgi:hypothetical protein
MHSVYLAKRKSKKAGQKEKENPDHFPLSPTPSIHARGSSSGPLDRGPARVLGARDRAWPRQRARAAALVRRVAPVPRVRA